MNIALARAYVILDRLVFHQLRRSAKLRDCCALMRQHLEQSDGLTDLRELCEAGAEEEELLWLLLGSQGLPGLNTSQEVFGWPVEELGKGFGAMERAARFVEKTRRYPFGILLQLADPFAAQLREHLLSYRELARDAQRDFTGHGSEWFLNVAKGRLVIHVTHRTKTREPHDREVSGLIAAATVTEYDAAAQKSFRAKYKRLLSADLDPYTTQSREQREKSIQVLEQALAGDTGLASMTDRLVSQFGRLNRFRTPR